jgi:hypothetical protein
VTVVGLLGTVMAASLYVCSQTVDVPSYNMTMFEVDSNTETMTEYLNFIAKYGRTYATKQDTANRYRVFKENYNIISDHNKKEDDVPFTLEVN